MKDTRFWEPFVNQPLHPIPVEIGPFAASVKYPIPAFGYLGPECHECPKVRRHRMEVEVASDDVPQPFPLNADRLMHTPSHLLFDHPQLHPHTVPPGLPFDLEFTRAGFAADEGE